jgi:YD repeat-containing protein
MKRFFYKIVITFIILIAIAPPMLSAQPREPQNVYRVMVKSRYILENGKRTNQYFALEQQIKDSLNRLHTEVFYDWETRYPHNYRWHYFDGQTKYKTEFYENEKLARIEEYTYQKDSLLSKLVVKTVKEDMVTFRVRVDYSYNSVGKISQATGFNEKGRRGFRAKYTYDAFGTEIERKVKGNRSTPPDSIQYLKRSVSYDSLGRVNHERLVLEKSKTSRSTQEKTYTYDENGNLTEMVLRDENGNQLTRNEYFYRKDNRIRMQNVYNANNELIDCLAWRYEIYKTSDRRQRILE